MRAHEILNNPFLNKGTAFTMKERQELGLIGPPVSNNWGTSWTNLRTIFDKTIWFRKTSFLDGNF